MDFDLLLGSGDFSADGALMRALARRNPVSGTARLAYGRGEAGRLRALLASAEALREGDDALARLAGQGGAILAWARGAAAENGVRLPAWRGAPRIGVALGRLCAGGEQALTRGRLLFALRELDGVQGLTQAELWAVPAALRAALLRALAGIARGAAERARRCAAAERWVQRPGRVPAGADEAFVAHALKRAGEDGLPEARRRLEAWLEARGMTAEAAVARAASRRAEALLRLDNLLAAKRMLDALDWRACFEALSGVERALAEDPEGTYPAMDEPSRDAVRAQVSALARRLGVGELAVARSAVRAAEAGEGVRGGVCWWLYDDEGRRALLRRMGRGGVRLRRLVPDPSGRGVTAALLGLSALLSVLLAALAGSPWLWGACGVLGWSCASAAVGRCCSRLCRPARLLKLELERVPEDCRTLAVMPVLLSSPERARAVCGQLEALGCLEADENMAFALLGDLPDAPVQALPGDGATLEAAREAISAMNRRAGREKYALLCRERTLLAADGVWMGRDRKRGALEDLNRLLLGREGAEAAFGAEGTACGRLRGRFRYVVTLDADTRVLPGDLRRMIGAMAHPLNRPGDGRGFALLQPRMELLPSACRSDFARLFSGGGGVDAYPVSVSNLWQDMTGRGIYAGKGIYDAAAFQRRLDGALPEGRVLSHDLIEGAAAGAGFLGDVALYDGCPGALASWTARLHRWTRGDWQLLPALLGRWPGLRGRLGAADRFHLLDNLVRSLRAPALLTLLVGGIWTGSDGALLAALAVSYLEPLLAPLGGDGLAWRRATAHLAALPLLAWTSLDAILRTLWRVGFSGRRLLQWVTAADAEAGGARRRAMAAPGLAAAALLLPGLLVPGRSLTALALGALFAVGPGWLGDMEAPDVAPVPSREDRRVFLELARETWRFFADNTGADSRPLPPDNVQLDPPVGAARRTSPTNIGLYLLSCLSARRLGFIGAPELRARTTAALEAVEAMEKWRGHLYNWYDIDTGAPLRPRYVSSVDSGNLAAALLLCAGAKETEPGLARRMEALAERMELSALYDGRRELFFIGMDVENGRLSDAHYDLLASEARILSFTGMMLGQVPPRHWRRLGRACARVDGGVAPLSWSGTLFEYLMPELLMPAPAGTLLGEGVRAAARAQMALGRRLKRPWGVSESGYSALDGALNYQYRAFGLRSLALDGEASEGVTAPYACALAAALFPGAVADNLRGMRALGWAGEWGLYEAADYLRPNPDGSPALVLSHMAHHQGMILCALCNVLTGGSLGRDFMGLPPARALSPLLEERPCAAAGPRQSPIRRGRGPQAAGRMPVRRPSPEALAPETHLLYGAGASALCTDDGAVHYWRGDVWATRFPDALQGRADMARTWLTCEGGRLALGEPSARAAFEAGAARFAGRLGGVEAALSLCVSPEDGTLLRVVDLRNGGERSVDCAVTDVVPVALSHAADWRAHAPFQLLFVRAEPLEGDALLFRRRPGGPGAVKARLVHLAAGPGEITRAADYDRLAGRMGDAGRSKALDGPLPGGTQESLNPASALRVALRLGPGERARVRFALCLLDGETPAGDWLERWRDPVQTERTARLAATHARSALGFLGLDEADHALLQRSAALLADGGLAAEARGPRRGEAAAPRSALWPLGLSGDRPILALSVRRAEDAPAVRWVIRAHGFYRAAGLTADLALLDDGGPGYARPVGDMLEALVSASHLNRLRGVPGGVWLIDGSAVAPEGRRALVRHASMALDGGRDPAEQVRALLSALVGPRPASLRPMDLGPSLLAGGARLLDNGCGGFRPREGYEIDVLPEQLPPAPWCNLLANGAGGALLSERGGGFVWRGNSREGRLTPYGNDGMREGWGLMLYLVDPDRGEYLRLLPGERPQVRWRVLHGEGASRYAFENRRAAGEVRLSMDGERPELRIEVKLENRELRGGGLWLWACVDWLLGSDRRDAVALNCWQEDGLCLAAGAAEGVGWLAADDPAARPGPGRCAFLGRGSLDAPEGLGLQDGGGGWTLAVPLGLEGPGRRRVRLALGWAEDVQSARARAAVLGRAQEADAPGRPQLEIDTPDAGLNALFNGFLRRQIRAARVFGRAGLCQPGGAWGFRDQLQDMLALMHDDPALAREHLLRCAARQFEAGDVLHWWHEPCRGVRTRISDDMLFLPWVTAAYVTLTGDTGVLDEPVPYLRSVEIPEGREDVYADMTPGELCESLHGHCMRAFRRADRRGRHGLLLMGAGDWNDGMNRVGAKGSGESVWLTQFAAACAARYREIAPDEGDRVWLWRLGEELRGAVEAHGWDGGWYLRAYDDLGAPLGSADCEACRIDAISQAWAVLAGLDPARCRKAMDAAWEQLADGKAGLIRLLTPPFEGRGTDPGYIAAYPPGVRENGGQYTHGALWLLLALIRMGDGARAHRALQMLLPFNHSDTPEKARVYRAEPYVMAADVYDCPGHRGQGGWTWYTGAAGWMFSCVLALLGYERRGDRVRLNALLGDWPAAALTVPFGSSRYRLVSDKSADRTTLDGACVTGDFIRMIDDGQPHEARFPARGYW